MQSKSIAIIGADGMLGSDLVHYLGKRFSITPITKESYNTYLNKSFNVIINANGNSKRFWANKNVLEDFRLSTESVYSSLFDFQYKRYIYISSSDVYENHTNTDSTKETEQVNSNELSCYGFHKYLSELIIMKYAMNYIILRSSLILGRNLKKGPIYDIVHDQPLFISRESKIQMITTLAISDIINLFIQRNIFRTILNIGGEGTVNFSSIDKAFNRKIAYAAKTELQTYEMNVDKLKEIFPLKTSREYLREYLTYLK